MANRRTTGPIPAWRSALIGAGTLGALHLATLLAGSLTDLGSVPGAVRDALRGIAGHIAVFQLEILGSVAVAGAGFGLLARLLGAKTRGRVAIASVLMALLACARTVSHRPALFEDLLWRHGGWRAALEVLFAERIGPAAMDGALSAMLACAALVILWRHRAALRHPRTLALLAVAMVVLTASWWPRQHRYAGHGTAVIMLAADSLRPDRLSSEGYPRQTSPHIDALRSQGALVKELLVPIASTIPSWATFLTGVYPHKHGIRDIFPREEEIGLQLPKIPEILAAHGYATTVVSDYAGDMFSRIHFGFQKTDAPPAMSLEVVAERESLQRLPLALGMLTGTIGERLFPITRFLTNNADPGMLTDRITDQLHRLEDTDKPFFLAAFYSVTHVPFATPMPDGALYTRRDYQGQSRYSYDIQKFNDLAHLNERPSDADVEQIRALYDGAVHSFDREVGRILAQLDADGVKDRIVIIAGDHGENLFEPGNTTEHGKWFSGGEAANRTVMLLQGTGVPKGDITGLRSGVDFAPTLLQLLHLPAPATDGQSLLEPVPPDRTVFAETTTWLGGAADRPPDTIPYPPIVDLLEPEADSHALVLRRRYADVAVTAKLREARQGPWQLIYTPTPDGVSFQLYDLLNDPSGQTDVAKEHPDIALPLAAKLFDWMEQDPIRWLDGKRHLVARRER